MYADKITDSMDKAIKETMRRRTIQEEYNKEHGIIPQTIKKEIRDLISNVDDNKEKQSSPKKKDKKELLKMIDEIEESMREAAKELDFERAMQLRDALFELKSEL